MFQPSAPLYIYTEAVGILARVTRRIVDTRDVLLIQVKGKGLSIFITLRILADEDTMTSDNE